jgi:hypothetical protein
MLVVCGSHARLPVTVSTTTQFSYRTPVTPVTDPSSFGIVSTKMMSPRHSQVEVRGGLGAAAFVEAGTVQPTSHHSLLLYYSRKYTDTDRA